MPQIRNVAKENNFGQTSKHSDEANNRFQAHNRTREIALAPRNQSPRTNNGFFSALFCQQTRPRNDADPTKPQVENKPKKKLKRDKNDEKNIQEE